MPDDVENLGTGPNGTTGEQAQTETAETAEATASQEETTEGGGEGSEFVMPEKFAGKSPEEIARAYAELERKLGSRAKPEEKAEEAFPDLDFGEEGDTSKAEVQPGKAAPAPEAEEPEASAGKGTWGKALYDAFLAGDHAKMEDILVQINAQTAPQFFEQLRGRERQVERLREVIRAAHPELVAKHDSAVLKKMQETGMGYGDAFKSVAVSDLIRKGIEHGRKLERETKGQAGAETITGGRPGGRGSPVNLAEKIRTAGPSREGFNRLFPPI